MIAPVFKKMAGASAGLLSADFVKASPVERDGMSWTAEKLHLEQLPLQLQRQSAMANALTLEGLEKYAPQNYGDIRRVESIDEVLFVLI